MRALDALARRYRIEVIGVRDRQISHAEALAAKRRAHIVIDECVTGSYHRNSLEGLSAGSVVVNGVGLLEGVAAVFRRCAGDAPDLPFVYADLPSLEGRLSALIESGPSALVEMGRHNRAWMERHWDFSAQWDRFWQPAMDAALTRADPVHPKAVRSAPESAEVLERPVATERTVAGSARGGVSVVIPHGGAERLPHLAASLANLSRCAAVAEVVIAEMGTEPWHSNCPRRGKPNTSSWKSARSSRAPGR
jgi:hypothetical protein